MTVATGRTSLIHYVGLLLRWFSMHNNVLSRVVHVTELSNNNFSFNDYLIVIGTDRVVAFFVTSNAHRVNIDRK